MSWCAVCYYSRIYMDSGDTLTKDRVLTVTCTSYHANIATLDFHSMLSVFYSLLF